MSIEETFEHWGNPWGGWYTQVRPGLCLSPQGNMPASHLSTGQSKGGGIEGEDVPLDCAPFLWCGLRRASHWDQPEPWNQKTTERPLGGGVGRVEFSSPPLLTIKKIPSQWTRHLGSRASVTFPGWPCPSAPCLCPLGIFYLIPKTRLFKMKYL